MNELHPLGEMIQTAQNQNGWSTRDLEREAERHGLSMKHSNFSRLKLEPVIAIKASQIEVLSKVLRRSPQIVAKAAIASMGVDMDSPTHDVPDAIRSSDEFSARDQRILLSVIDAMREDESGTNGQQGKYDPHPPRPLRSVAPSGDTSQGQKTGAPDDFELMLDQLGVHQLHGEDAKNYPAPADPLAAHQPFETELEKFDREHGERGEDDQDTGEVE